MRTISPALAAAQLVRSPRHTVSVTFATRGQGPYDDMVQWHRDAAGEAGSARVAVAGPFPDGSALLFKSSGVGINLYKITSADSFGAWAALPAPVVLLPGIPINTMDGAFVGSTARLFYGSAAGLRYIESSNSGLSWGAPVTITATLVPTLDLTAYHDGSTWRIGYSTGTAGSLVAHLATWNGASWVIADYGAGWRFVGYLDHAWYVFLKRSSTVGDRIVGQQYTTGSGFAGAPVRMDAAPGGLLGVQIHWATIGSACGSRMMLVCEGGEAGKAAVGISAVWLYNAGDGEKPVMDEPILYPSLAVDTDQARLRLLETAGALWARSWVIGDTLRLRAERVVAPVGEFSPSKYTYEEGELRMEFSTQSAPTHNPTPGVVPGATPGMLASVTRGCFDMEGNGGAETITFVVYRTEYGRDVVRLVLRDALGHLGSARLRRPVLLSPGEGGDFDALSALRLAIARAGLEVHADYTDVGTVARVTGEPGESLAGVVSGLARVTLILVPTPGDDLSLTLIPMALNPAINAGWTSISGQYPYLAAGGGHHVIWERGDRTPEDGATVRAWDIIFINDARRYSFSTVVGLNDPDPQNGGRVVFQDGPRLDGLRPVGVYQVNRTLYAQAVDEVAEAEARRQMIQQVDLWVDTNGHLGAELYDNVTVTDEERGVTESEYRIVEIKEVWERGRLTQRWGLASREWWNLL